MVQQLLGILVLQSVSHPLTWYGFDFIMMCPSYHLTVVSCLWMWSTIFGEFQHPPVNGCLTASCNFGALTGGDEHMGKTVSCFGGRTLLSLLPSTWSWVSHFPLCASVSTSDKCGDNNSNTYLIELL